MPNAINSPVSKRKVWDWRFLGEAPAIVRIVTPSRSKARGGVQTLAEYCVQPANLHRFWHSLPTFNWHDLGLETINFDHDAGILVFTIVTHLHPAAKHEDVLDILHRAWPAAEKSKFKRIFALLDIIETHSHPRKHRHFKPDHIQRRHLAAPPVFDPRAASEAAVREMQDARGGAWTGLELESRFKLTPATLHRRRKEHRIVHWRDANSQFHYPKWQFNPAGALLPGIQEVLQTFKSHDEWRVMRYFLAPWGELDGRAPLDILKEGAIDKVVAHAKAHAEENSW